jgi:hypothetical protein
MRLYTSPKGEWSGTQADAKKLGAFVETDVPTVKADLLAFLNDHSVMINKLKELGYEAPQPTTAPAEPAKPREIKQNSWDEFNTVKKHLETCNREAVFTIMNLAIQRYYELDGVEE